MWILFAICSALGLGFYDVMKKISVRDNNVPIIVCRMLGGDIRRAILGEQVGTIVHDC